MNLFRRALYAGYRLFGQRGAVVLAYHSIGASDSPWTVAPEAFEAQMRWLAENHFTIVSLDTLAEYRRTGSIPPSTIAITFDDGYRDNYTVALPILEKYRLPATLFLTTSDIGGARTLVQGGRYEILSEDELQSLAGSGLMTIGAHSVTHPKFTKIDGAEIEQEVRGSKEYIEQLLGTPCVHFAYPHGRHSPEAYEAVARAGIRYAYTTEHGIITSASNDYALPRSAIASATSFTEFKAIARTGIVSLARLRRSWKL